MCCEWLQMWWVFLKMFVFLCENLNSWGQNQYSIVSCYCINTWTTSINVFNVSHFCKYTYQYNFWYWNNKINCFFCPLDFFSCQISRGQVKQGWKEVGQNKYGDIWEGNQKCVWFSGPILDFLMRMETRTWICDLQGVWYENTVLQEYDKHEG